MTAGNYFQVTHTNLIKQINLNHTFLILYLFIFCLHLTDSTGHGLALSKSSEYTDVHVPFNIFCYSTCYSPNSTSVSAYVLLLTYQ